MKLIVEGQRDNKWDNIVVEVTDEQEGVQRFKKQFGYFPAVITKYSDANDQEPETLRIVGVCEVCEHAVFVGEPYNMDEDFIYCKDHLFREDDDGKEDRETGD